MGLNIGVEVHQQTQYSAYDEYTLPKESLEELDEKFYDFMEQRWPNHNELFGHHVEFNAQDKIYTFDCRMARYGEKFGYELTPVFQALMEFVLSVFSYDDLQLRTYWSP